MKKIALEKWEKNKGAIRRYIEGRINIWTDGTVSLAVDKEVFLEEVLNIAYGNDTSRLYFQLVDFGDLQGTLIAIFSEGNNYQPTIYDTHYAVLDYGSCSGCDAILAANSIDDLFTIAKDIALSAILAANSIDDLCTIAKDIVLSAKPLDENYCDKEWAEDCTV